MWESFGINKRPAPKRTIDRQAGEASTTVRPSAGHICPGFLRLSSALGRGTSDPKHGLDYKDGDCCRGCLSRVFILQKAAEEIYFRYTWS